MNILFLLKSLDTGGVEVVTATLANKFQEEGHNVFLWSFSEGKNMLINRLNKDVNLIYGKGFRISKDNIYSLRNTLIENNINVVINQWGLPFIPAYTLKKAAKGLDLKILAVYHNDPSTNGRLKNIEIAIKNSRSITKQIALHLKFYLYKCITSASMRYIYRNSDKFIVLSNSFVDGFKRFTKIKNATKLTVITNPITIDTSDYIYNFNEKELEVIFVGRIDFNQKRVHRIIETWALLEQNYPNWTLKIVGDGEKRKDIEELTKNLNLKNVRFEGFQYPKPYYEKASILILTSEYEGFGLVISEAMSFGVIPVVYGSYSAVYDIIEDNRDGSILPFCKNGFNAEGMAKRLSALMNDEKMRDSMALAAIEKSKNYSIEEIYRKWMEVITNLML